MDIQEIGNALIVGSHRHVVIGVLRGKPGPQGFRALLDRLHAIAKEYPERQAIINILEANAFLPDQQERKELSETMKELDATSKVTVMLVMEARGFGAATFRAVVAGLSFLSGKAQKAFARVDDAIAVAAEDVPVAERAAFKASLAEAISTLRSRGKAAVPPT